MWRRVRLYCFLPLLTNCNIMRVARMTASSRNECGGLSRVVQVQIRGRCEGGRCDVACFEFSPLSLLPCHTSHVTRHTSHVTRHTPQAHPPLLFPYRFSTRCRLKQRASASART
jgi:hypothetical protein